MVVRDLDHYPVMFLTLQTIMKGKESQRVKLCSMVTESISEILMQIHSLQLFFRTSLIITFAECLFGIFIDFIASFIREGVISFI